MPPFCLLRRPCSWPFLGGAEPTEPNCGGRNSLPLGCAGSDPSEVVTVTLHRRGCLLPWQRGCHQGCVCPCTKGGVGETPTFWRQKHSAWRRSPSGDGCWEVTEPPWAARALRSPLACLPKSYGCFLSSPAMEKEEGASLEASALCLCSSGRVHAPSIHTHCTNGETEAMRGEETCPRPAGSVRCRITGAAPEAGLAGVGIRAFPLISSVSLGKSLSPLSLSVLVCKTGTTAVSRAVAHLFFVVVVKYAIQVFSRYSEKYDSLGYCATVITTYFQIISITPKGNATRIHSHPVPTSPSPWQPPAHILSL